MKTLHDVAWSIRNRPLEEARKDYILPAPDWLSVRRELEEMAAITINHQNYFYLCGAKVVKDPRNVQNS